MRRSVGSTRVSLVRGQGRTWQAGPVDRLLLLDSASLYFRAFFGVPEQGRSPSGTPTNAVRGFADMIATLVTAHRPSHLVAAWDEDWRPQWRVDLIPSYKTHRLVEGSASVEESPDELAVQVPVIADLLGAVGLARVGAAGYEADDVIGTLAHRHGGAMAVDVVTGDRDLLQLVDDERSIRVLYTGKGGVREPDVATQSFLQDRYAVPTGRAYLDMSILRGDTSDGLPGVKGIGDKTAAALIGEFGSLAAVREAVRSGDARIAGARRRNLEEADGYLDAAERVVAVATDIALPPGSYALPTEIADPALLEDLVVTHGLDSPVRRLLTALGLL